MTKDEFLRILPGLIGDYKPAPDVIKHIGNVDLLMIIGPSGAGKTTLINQLNIEFVPSHTTRAPRPGEKDGEDFYFVDDYDHAIAQIEKGVFVQMVVGVSGDLYATKASSYPLSGLAVMPVLADVIPLFRKIGFKSTLSVFITPPSYDVWMKRLGAHKLEPIALKNRLTEARRSFEFSLNDTQTHFILNDELAVASQQVLELVDGKTDSGRENKAKMAAQSILDELK